MTKTDQLNDLFNEWKKKQVDEDDDSLKLTMLQGGNVVEKDFFCADGIICEEEFDNEKSKVLFIANEPNIEDKSNIVDGKKPQSESSQIDEFIKYYDSHHDDWRGKLRKKICEIIYPAVIDFNAIVFPVDKGWENAKKIAFMNLNKRGGTSNIGKYLKAYCVVYKEQILKEILYINPDIIVWLGKSSFELCADDLFDEIEKKNGCVLVKSQGSIFPVIITYHPSYGVIQSTHITEQMRGEFARKEAEKYKEYIK